jgi:hypothetical protein
MGCDDRPLSGSIIQAPRGRHWPGGDGCQSLVYASQVGSEVNCRECPLWIKLSPPANNGECLK